VPPHSGKLELRAIRTVAVEFKLAVEGFSTNAFFILIDNRQAESLDEEFVVGPQTTVSFIKLTPLVGG
jgi:hypothetical protein